MPGSLFATTDDGAARIVVMLLVATSSLACVRTTTLRGSALQTLQAGRDDAVVLEPPAPAEDGELAIRLEPSSRVRLKTVNQGETNWVSARSLRLSEGALSWVGGDGRLKTVRLEDIRSVDVTTFDRGLSFALVLSALMSGFSSLAVISTFESPTLDERADATDATDATLSGPAPVDQLFTERASRADRVRFVVAQDLGSSLGTTPDAFFSTRVGVRVRDFVEFSVGLRLLSPDYLLRGLFGPLQPRGATFIPGVMSRLLVIGGLDPGHRVALLIGGELGFDPTLSGRVLWGLEVRPVGQLHVTILPLTPLFGPTGVSWGLSVDTAWHF